MFHDLKVSREHLFLKEPLRLSELICSCSWPVTRMSRNKFRDISNSSPTDWKADFRCKALSGKEKGTLKAYDFKSCFGILVF